MDNVGRHHIKVDPATGYAADTGCQVAPSCLRCYLPACKYDDIQGYQNWQQQERRRETAARMRELETMPKQQAVEVVAAEFSVDPRTVYRRLAKGDGT